MAKTKKLRKSAARFRKNEPALHALYSKAIDYMASYIKKSGAAEVTVRIVNDTIVDCYAN